IPGIGVPRIRFSTPCSRRNVMLNASAVNVVDITLIPAIPGTITLRSCWLPCRIAPKNARNSSGSRKLKKAALGLRQNKRRSSRYWRQASVTTSGILASLRVGSGQLQVHVFERRPADGQALQPFATRQRRARQLVQQRRWVIGLVLDETAGAVAVGDPVQPRAPAKRMRLAFDQDPSVLDDRHPVGKCLGLVQIVGGEQHGLAEL